MSARQGPTSPSKVQAGREAAGRGTNGQRFSRTSRMTGPPPRLRANMTDADANPGGVRGEMNRTTTELASQAPIPFPTLPLSGGARKGVL